MSTGITRRSLSCLTGKPTPLIKISLGASGGNDNKEDTDIDENKEFNDADLENVNVKKLIDKFEEST